ncbi:hypothetical protein DRE_01291 [Drechslerella stenobrocha 248]|uniref:Uncharacterized protein n=1 Tax=Drechslerella stenobrocha 248 TaxID=1043628 RepID=W7HLI8_9PEZI|nr:hypothetical protein DRE_01291 [Drechslerella stenobrocha 248]
MPQEGWKPQVEIASQSHRTIYSIDNIQCFIAIAIEIIIIVLILVFNFLDITLCLPGILPNYSRALYVCGTTVLVTASTAFVMRQICLQWIYYTDMKEVRTADEAQTAGSRRIDVLLGVGSYNHYFRYWGTTVSLLLVSLRTATIVTALTPSIVLKTFKTTSHLTPDALNCTTLSNDPEAGLINWRLENGTFITLQDSSCLASPAFSILNAISTSDVGTDGYAYTIAGAGVTRSSIGVPYDAYNGLKGLDKVFWGADMTSHGGISLQESTQCLPVFVNNPARCRRRGNVVPGHNNLTVHLGPDCIVSTPIFGVNLQTDGASASGFCTEGRGVGKITYVIGSVNSHAHQLALAVPDAFAVDTADPKSYSVACDIDISSGVEFRETTVSRNYEPPSLELRDGLGIDPAAEFIVSSTYTARSICDQSPSANLWNSDKKQSDILTAGALAIGAGVALPLFEQNRYNDGWWDALSGAVIGRNSGSFAFQSSRNALEDVLGAVAAIGVGQYVGSAQRAQSGNDALAPTGWSGYARIMGYRIGPGGRWGVLLIVPEVWTAIVLVVLITRRLRL